MQQTLEIRVNASTTRDEVQETMDSSDDVSLFENFSKALDYII